jgi:hypothetical protein
MQPGPVGRDAAQCKVDVVIKGVRSQAFGDIAFPRMESRQAR